MAEEPVELSARIEDDGESGSSSGSGSESEAEEKEIEWLATTREKRSNAGNRLHSLLQQEDPDDDLELLFQEDEDDAGFSDAGADSDVQMDSSSDEEDQGPAAGDDLEGEKELQRQAKVEKVKKRKFEGGVPKVFKKRVKIDLSVSQAPAPRPKKKSERASWLPTAEEAPTRASGRKSTKIMKEQLHAQMIDREIKRLRQLANMEKAAAAKEAAKKPALTQADRLAEAARVEKANFRSLSRWEEAEQHREEERKAKLLALKNRTLDSPAITWWSGMAEWVGGKLKHVGKNLVVEEKEKPAPRKKKGAEIDAGSDIGSVLGAGSKDTKALTPGESLVPIVLDKGEGSSASRQGTSSTELPTIPVFVDGSVGLETVTESNNHTESTPIQTPTIPIAPVISIPPSPKVVPTPHYNYGPPKSSFLAPPAGLPLFAPPLPMQHIPFYQNLAYSQFTPAPSMLDGSAPVPGLGYNLPQQQPHFIPAVPYSFKQPLPPPGPPLPAAPPAVEYAARNYIILENFDELATRDKTVQMQILFGGRKFGKCPKPKDAQEKCVITSLPARYRDPDTGLAYRDSRAYQEIQKLKRGEYKWSKLLGAYVGLGTYHAKGVPERFRGALLMPKIPLAGKEDAAV